MAYQSITMRDLYQHLGKLKAGEVILDVRSAEEFRDGHVPGSKNIPHDQVTAHIDELRKYEKVYIHCQAGGRAGRAAQALAGMGLNNLVCISFGGMGDWRAAGYPVEK